MTAVEAIRAARACGGRLSVDNTSIVYEAETPPPTAVVGSLRRYKAEIIDVLLEERHDVVRWIAEHFRSSPVGFCAYCGEGQRDDDPFMILFVGEDRADIHAECYPLWLADREAEAQAALSLSSAAPCRA